MEEKETIINKVGDVVLSKFKLPILFTYLVVLIIYNWHIILYMLFKNQEIDLKINYIQEKYHDVYINNIVIPIIISFLYNLLFPILQVSINLIFSWFKRKNLNLNRREELDDAYHKFELQRNLTGQQPLERLQANIELLTSENQKLLNDNKNLLERLKDENLKDENSNKFALTVNAKKEKELKDTTENLLNIHTTLNTYEKSAFLDLISYFNSPKKELSQNSIKNISLNSNFIDPALNLLLENNIIESFYNGNNYVYEPTILGYEILEYLKANYAERL